MRRPLNGLRLANPYLAPASQKWPGSVTYPRISAITLAGLREEKTPTTFCVRGSPTLPLRGPPPHALRGEVCPRIPRGSTVRSIAWPGSFEVSRDGPPEQVRG